MNYNTGANEQSFLIFPTWIWVLLICFIIAHVIGFTSSKDKKKYRDLMQGRLKSD